MGSSDHNHPAPGDVLRQSGGFVLLSRWRLRRRILLLALTLGLVPSLLAVLVATAYALQAIRSFAVEEARNSVYDRAEALGRRIQDDATWLEAVARAGPRADGAPLPTSPSGHRISMVDSTGTPRRGEPVPTALMLACTSVEANLFALEVATEGERGLWLAARASPAIVARDSPAADNWLALRIPMPAPGVSGFEFAGIDPADMVMYSTKTGLLTPREFSAEVQQLFASTDMNAAGSGIVPSVGNPEVVYAFTRVGALTGLTAPTGAETSLFVLQRVNLEAASAPLFYGFWRIAVYGLLFVAFVGWLGIWLSTRLVRPIMQLRSAFHRLEQGDLDSRVELHTGDELEELGVSMNRMAETLQGTYHTLADKLLQLDEKAKQLALAYEIAKAINQSLNLQKLLNEVVSQVRQVVSAERIVLCLLEEGRVEVACVWPAAGWDFRRGGRLELGPDSLVWRTLETGNLAVYPISPEGSTPEERAFSVTGVRSLCIVPLLATTGAVGVLLMADQESTAFRETEVAILNALSPTLANAVEHGRLFARQGKFAEELEQQVQERTAELARAQAQLLQVEKFAAAGELASNVAHEVNNPLSIIKNHLHLVQGHIMRSELANEDATFVREGLRIIDEEIDRIARIVHQLRRIGQPVQHTLANVEVNAEIDIVLQLFRQTFCQKKLQVELDADSRLRSVKLCSDYLHQVLMNLLRNAYDAVEVGGSIHIRTIAHHPSHDTFIILVRDDGHGIPADKLNRIFDPFFTTKKDGKGTGLGLSVSYGLAVQMGGRIEVDSQEGRGTTMRVILPLKPPADADTEDLGSPHVRRKGERIIIG